jgi:dinuclear metal center YbgI/SA1388 family protein
LNIGERLCALAEEVRGKHVLDIGTDHGKLPAQLVYLGKCASAVAADINEEPLRSAKLTAERLGVAEKIGFVRSDGLEAIDTEGISDIVIAGMGGELIAGILRRGDEKITGKNLILQAMSKSDLLFDFLTENSFRFSAIKNIAENGRNYTYFVCEKSDNKNPSTRDVYNALDIIAPFINAAQWDNSGVLVGRADETAVSGVLCCTDITAKTVREAVKHGANVILSHHPVIGFDPLKRLPYPHPAALAAAAGITCICCHTPFDVSPFGMNRLFLKTFEKAVCGVYDTAVLDKMYEDFGYGVIFTLKTPQKTGEITAKLKAALGTAVVRFAGDKLIKTAAFCSGSGSVYLEKIISEGKVDCYITGDLKQAGFIDAANAGISLIDCGHWGSEHCFSDFAAGFIKSQYPTVSVTIFEEEPFDII